MSAVEPITIREGAELELAAPQTTTELLLDLTRVAPEEAVREHARLMRMAQSGALTGGLGHLPIDVMAASAAGAVAGIISAVPFFDSGSPGLLGFAIAYTLAALPAAASAFFVAETRQTWRDLRATPPPHVTLTLPVGVVESSDLTVETRALLRLVRARDRAVARGVDLTRADALRRSHYAACVSVAHVQTLRAHLRSVDTEVMEPRQLAAVAQQRALLEATASAAAEECARVAALLDAATPDLPLDAAARRVALDASVERGDELADRAIASTSASEIRALAAGDNEGDR